MSAMHLFKLVTALFITQLIVCNTSFSQSKLMEGYIITMEKDTVKGFIRHEGWTESPVNIQFKTKENDLEEKFSVYEINEFFILGTGELYKSKKIGVLNITLDQIYSTAPSLLAKDSIQIFLQEIVSGKMARLYEFVNTAEESHFFVEKEDKLIELYNYPFNKEVDGKKYLLVYDEYKRQLAELTRDAEKFGSAIPGYLEKPLKRYIENYNQYFSGKNSVSPVTDNGLTFDLDLNAGLENWHELPLDVSQKLTYGVGVRMNLPRRFRNRFFKVGCL